MKFALLILFPFILNNAFADVDQMRVAGIKKRTVTYKSINGLALMADIYEAESRAAFRPCIVWLHGGGLIFGSRGDLPQEQRDLYVEAGYVVIAIDYRLAPETKLPEILEDVKDAITWVRVNARQSLGIDSNRVFVIGHSGGAYLALLTGSHMTNPPAGIISFYGYGEIEGAWYTEPSEFYRKQGLIPQDSIARFIRDTPISSASVADRIRIYIYSRQSGTWPIMITDHRPDLDSRWYLPYTPVKNIRQNFPPVLLIHGSNDNDVPYEQSIMLRNELADKKIPHELITLQGSGHVFDLFEGGFKNLRIVDVFRKVLVFMKELPR